MARVRVLCSETGRTLSFSIIERILCRWGTVEEIVTDNWTAYVGTQDWLANKCSVLISAYNSKAGRIAQHQHRSIQESLIKACQGDTSK